MTETYTAIVAELTRRRDTLTAELSRLNTAIAAIMPLLASERPASEFVPGSFQHSVQTSLLGVVAPSAEPAKVGNYSRLSVRWAALWHLDEFAKGLLRNVEVAEAIKAGGYHSGAESFPNAVSAVLSGMRAKGEIDGNPESGYYITEHGRQVWRNIKDGERFKAAMKATPQTSEPTLLSVQ